jgi:hypothetical protein
MGVSVLSKHRQRSLRSAARASVLGDGLLERTRSTSLALLGVTAAIGLAMVALALNQNWPLIAGAPIPGFGSQHQAVGKAAVVAKARTRAGRPAISAATGQAASPRVSSGKPRSRPGVTVALAGSQAPQAAGLVASHPTPASPAAAGPPSEAAPDPTPVAQQPAPAVTPAPAPAVAAVPVSSSSSSPPSTASETPESPIPSQVPPAGNEGDEHGHGHTSHGHGHSHGGDDSETSDSNESPETAPAPTETAQSEADAPEESEESEQSHSSSWSHGGGHGHGHW